METSVNNFTTISDITRKNAFKKSNCGMHMDAKAFHPSTNLMPPSPPSITSSIGFNFIASTDITFNTTAFEAETKRLNQLNTAKSEVQNTPHIPSKYATTYELEKYDENRMLIFNHCHFNDGERRRGTEKDEEALRNTFESFGFTIQTFRDLKKQQLIDTIKQFSRKLDFSNYGCICVAVMTHGHDRPGYLEAYDQHYSEQEIFQPFDASKNPSLAGKPIIFIIQACRGAKASVKVGPMKVRRRLQLDIDDDWEDYHLPVDADRIVFHSSAVGRASIRHTEDGSWFIQALCKKIQECGHKNDLETIFRMVKREVALERETIKEWKQMPVVTSTLLRELYLVRKGQSTPSKDVVDYSSIYSAPCKLHQQSGKPMDIDALKEPYENRDFLLKPFKPYHMPCSCFLEYFEYLKDCLEGYIHHNPEDIVAKTLLKMMQLVDEGAEYNLQKFSFIQSVWEHFDANMDKFPPESAKFIYRKYH